MYGQEVRCIKLSPRTGRPKSEDSKHKKIQIRLSDEEYNLITDCASRLQLTKTGVIMKGIELVKAQIAQKK